MIIKDFRKILHGGDYNPDQWIHVPGTVDRDFELMDEAHCNTFSVAIFSWSQLEVEPDHFEFGYIYSLREKREEAVPRDAVGPPSPHGLAERWPDSRRADRAGHRDIQGSRQNSCFSSPGYGNGSGSWTGNSRNGTQNTPLWGDGTSRMNTMGSAVAICAEPFSRFSPETVWHAGETQSGILVRILGASFYGLETGRAVRFLDGRRGAGLVEILYGGDRRLFPHGD